MSRAEGALKKKQQETTLKQGGRKDMQGVKHKYEVISAPTARDFFYIIKAENQSKARWMQGHARYKKYIS